MHLLLLAAAAALALLVVPDASMKPRGSEAPVAAILALLGVCVGLPYFCLATTGPLVQAWFARAQPGRSPYRLYALSNLGSFLALLSFPYLFEPAFELTQLGRVWTWGFWLFALCCTALTLRVLTLAPGAAAMPSPAAAAADTNAARPSRARRLAWVALPALASLMFIATTDHVSHDIAPEPRLWIATLSLYLLTFIITFDHPRWYRRRWVAVAGLVAIVLLTGRNDIPEWFGLQADYGVTGVRWSHLATMFIVCFLCHGELYRLRPQDPRDLTRFYLCMSFGGACGGLFVALVATHWFSDYHEWPLSLVAALALACAVLWPRGRPAARAGVAFAGLLSAALVLHWEDPLGWRNTSGGDHVDVRLYQSRNFYGTVSVEERRHRLDPSRDYRVFYSGQIIHGLQYLAPDQQRRPVTYYSEGSGVGETLAYAMARQPSLRVAVIGLGVGTLASYAREADHYDFFEINPDVVQVAERWFTNLTECRARTRQVIVGDARLTLEQLPDDTRYDVIALDAFSGGSLPIHLLTREAFELYKRRLNPGGFIAVHITNAYLNLYPVVRRQAEALGMGFRNKSQAPDRPRHVRRNHYFIVTDDARYLARYPSVNRTLFDDADRPIGVEDPNLPGVPLWTDHFSSLNPIERAD